MITIIRQYIEPVAWRPCVNMEFLRSVWHSLFRQLSRTNLKERNGKQLLDIHTLHGLRSQRAIMGKVADETTEREGRNAIKENILIHIHIEKR